MNLVFRLTGESLDGGACCLGSQLVQIITALSPSLGDVVWYAADIELNNGVFPICEQSPAFVGSSRRLIEFVGSVDQFWRGVFLAVASTTAKPRFRDAINTEDASTADLGDAVVEIRAFDTTYFEILTNAIKVGDVVVNRFGVHAVAPERLDANTGYSHPLNAVGLNNGPRIEKA